MSFRTVARRAFLALAITYLTPLASVAHAQADTASVTRRLDQLERQLDSLRRVSARQQDRIMELDARGAAPAASSPDSGRHAPPSGIYAKPFVKRFGAGTALGGYVDVEYRYDLSNGRGAFDQHRLVPFIFSEITDRLHFGTEIEFEHGTRLEVEDGTPEGAGEVNVEFATLDYRFTDAASLRAGVILSPLGRFNLVHDSPINELTDRPLVAQQVIPGTLSEAGAGLFGTLYPTDRSLLTYEAYVVNGFTDELIPATPGERTLDIREAAGSRGAESAATANLVGRIGFSPMLGVEIGASAHWGPYGDGAGVDSVPERDAAIWALDWSWEHGALDVTGEYARLTAQLSSAAKAAGISNGRQGMYAQAAWHFGGGLVEPKATSRFTGVLRYDQVDFASDLAGDAQRRFTIGGNWRPVPDAAFKAEYQWNWAQPEGTATWRAAPRRVLFSLATYF